jgi:Protein of unknown function (DUF559)
VSTDCESTGGDIAPASTAPRPVTRRVAEDTDAEAMDPLPDRFTLGAHQRSHLLAAGIHDSELRGPLWQRSSYGHYAWAVTDLCHPRQRIHAAASRCHANVAVAGWAAAWMHGARDLDGLEPDGRPSPVPVCTTPGLRLVPGTNGAFTLRVSRSRLDPDEIVELDGVPCTSLVRTAFDAARFAPDLTEAVVALDALLRATHLEIADLVAYAERRRRWHGRLQVLQAAELSNAWTLSCPESRLRVIWQERAGLPVPLVNCTIVDHAARPVAMADMLDEEAWLVLEFDGAYHATSTQRGLDDQRTQRLHALGLHVARFVADDLRPSRRRSTANRLRLLRSRRLEEVADRRPAWSVLARHQAARFSDRSSRDTPACCPSNGH